MKNVLIPVLFFNLIACTSETQIDLSGKKYSEKKIISILKNKQNTEIITLNKTKASDTTLIFLKSFTNLKELYLAQTLISDHGLLEGLTKISTLTSLDLLDTKITDTGLKEVVLSNRNLSFLDLTDTDVTDEIVSSLLELKELKAINLINTDCSIKTVNKLKIKFPFCKITLSEGLKIITF